jgi:hypothetical protein
MASSLSYNDVVLVISLLYLSIDLQNEWHEFATCKWPVHRWLLGSYVFIVAFRLTHALGSTHAATGSGDFLLNLRHKDALPRMLMSLTWLCVLPLFTAWTAIGTFWLYDSKKHSPKCLPMGMPLCFIITWQALSYAWILIHTTLGGVAWILERHVQRAEGNLRAVEDPDTLARWGQVSQLAGYTALVNNSLEGLRPDQIKQLPEIVATEAFLGEEKECSICLTNLCPGDAVRQLGGCGHTFHRSCIDLWLLRRADCPLCKCSALGNVDSRHALPSEVEVDHWHV